MKKLLLILCVFSMTTHAQSNLPPCTSDPFNNCFGTFTGVGGGKYVGEWKYDKYHGQGTYIDANGDKYVGEWKDNKYHGQGIYTWPNGAKYLGQFKDGKNDGQGTFTYANGNKYVGQYKDDKRNGQGTYTFTDGRKYVGQFKDGNYDGFGTLYNANGSIFQQGLWRDDKFVQAQTPPTVTPPVIPKPPVNNAQDIKRQKCIRLGLAPGSADFQQCIN